ASAPQEEAFLNWTDGKRDKCIADRYDINKCDVGKALLHRKLNKRIYMELPEGEQELLSLTEDEGEDGLVYLLLQRPHGLNQAANSRQPPLVHQIQGSRYRPLCKHERNTKDIRRARWIFIINAIRKFGQKDAKTCLPLLEAVFHLTKATESESKDGTAKMSSKPYHSLVLSLTYLACSTRPTCRLPLLS
ncbi:hypothetical protein GN958_ATG21221, partial [Phytophthora infestans]